MTVHSGDRCGTDEFLALIGGEGGETTQMVQTDHLQEWENNCRFLGIHHLWGSTSEQSPCTKTACSFVFHLLR